MRTQVVFTGTAKNDLREIAVHLAKRSGRRELAVRFVRELQEQAAQIVADNQLNVRQTEALCKKLAKPPKEAKEPEPRGTLPVEVEESLKQALGSEVNVAYHGGKGKLTVHFYSDEQLRAFANLLGQYQTEE